MVREFQTMEVLIIGMLGVTAALAYAVALWVRRADADRRLYRVFMWGYPVTVALMLAGVSTVFAAIESFGSVRLLGLAVDWNTLLSAGMRVFYLGVLGSFTLLMVVGVGIELQEYREARS